jgi:hypothetical protein
VNRHDILPRAAIKLSIRAQVVATVGDLRPETRLTFWKPKE